ncbi:NPC intracellular cholesterol transporter 2 homolog a [Ixodes scapularis]|uniref:Major epididymal secretory protein HE1, putative n=1 Tax=Ixodes scapularis TaxID=6945 RepID=B7PNB2_IXOSC|nr:NPC intracellular cholesterol transporter 2 homolog a [Ixodes scapularis]EEC08084.1 major epididymal secretory protein HE1, putative [Ixodes scapularis]|eukprot:XP_002435260.1 major epididymal secretory protein HE1, putative [Ixodes scapularis]
MQHHFEAALLVCVIALLGQCSAIWKSCNADNGQVLDMRVTPGGDREVYILRKGTNVTLNIEFWSSVDSGSAKVRAHGMVMGVPIPLKMPNEDACVDCGISCPMRNGEKYLYKQGFEVKASYPKMSATIKWALGDDNGGTVACVLIPVEIVD